MLLKNYEKWIGPRHTASSGFSFADTSVTGGLATATDSAVVVDICRAAKPWNGAGVKLAGACFTPCTVGAVGAWNGSTDTERTGKVRVAADPALFTMRMMRRRILSGEMPFGSGATVEAKRNVWPRVE